MASLFLGARAPGVGTYIWKRAGGLSSWKFYRAPTRVAPKWFSNILFLSLDVWCSAAELGLGEPGRQTARGVQRCMFRMKATRCAGTPENTHRVFTQGATTWCRPVASERATVLHSSSDPGRGPFGLGATLEGEKAHTSLGSGTSASRWFQTWLRSRRPRAECDAATDIGEGRASAGSRGEA